MRKTFEAVLVVAVALLVVGCSDPATVEDACGAVTACDGVLDTCIEKGHELQDQADASGCSDEFDDYLSCLADAGCDYDTACKSEAAAVEDCGVSLG
ncbi:MAG: hypothetical protein U0271_38380 [Polyangiaceae bacterium]